ncbi:hypothetical protein BH23ACT12_BH23ACT12_07720 [soil metagenome]
MRRSRTKLRLVPTGPAARRQKAPRAAEVMMPGFVVGLAAAAALKYYLGKRRRNNSEEVGVLTAEVHSNGHGKVKLGSLDQFS